MAQKEAKQAKADLALLDGVSKSSGKSKKSSRKAKEAEAAAKAPDPEMRATLLADLTKAKEAAENAKGSMNTAAIKMFEFYTNLLLVKCCKYEKDRKEKANFRAAKKGRKKPNPVKQNFAQLRKKLDKLKNTLKKARKKSKKCRYKDSNSDSE